MKRVLFGFGRLGVEFLRSTALVSMVGDFGIRGAPLTLAVVFKPRHSSL